MPKFFVKEEQIQENQIIILGQDVNHIKKVLRAKIGDELQICNSQNGENFLCEIDNLEEEKIQKMIDELVAKAKKASEEYLKTMYILKQQNGNIRVTDIAKKMNCTKPSVNKAIYNLKDSGLLNYESYGTIELTEKGEDLAKKILEAYDIVYVFLKDVLNLDEEEAEREAEKIKLAITDKTINKLAKYVHKELGLTNLDCDYDINKEKCRCCARRTVLGDGGKKQLKDIKVI